MTIKYLFISLLLILSISSRQQIKIYYNWHVDQYTFLTKYLNRIQDGYFLQLGGFNPTELSNTIRLSNWKGIIVQANQRRAGQIRDYHFQDVTVLNLALSQKSGTMVTLYQHLDPGRSSIVEQIGQRQGKKQNLAGQFQVMTMSLADLCHKYYKTRPTFMSIDIQGIGQAVLRTNDWTNQKCLPQIIFAQVWPADYLPLKPGQKPLDQQLKALNYTIILDQNKDNQLFIHNSKLQFYQKQVQINKKLMQNKNVIGWSPFVGQVATKIISGLDRYAQPILDPNFMIIRQQSIIDIADINQYANSLSTVGKNRPILIMQYDQQFSKILIPNNNLYISDQTIQRIINNRSQTFLFRKIRTQIDHKELIVYIFDHQKYDQFNVVLIDSQTNKIIPEEYIRLSSVIDDKRRREVWIILFFGVSIIGFLIYLIKTTKKYNKIIQQKVSPLNLNTSTTI